MSGEACDVVGSDGRGGMQESQDMWGRFGVQFQDLLGWKE